jgi:hypothetical protein
LENFRKFGGALFLYLNIMKDDKNFFTVLETYGEAELVTVRDGAGLNFLIRVNDQHVFLIPHFSPDQSTGELTIQAVGISELIFDCSKEEFDIVKTAFKECQTLVSTFYYVVLENELRIPFRKIDIEKLLNLDLLPDERQKLQFVLDDFTFIYLVRDRETGFVKIGKSIDPQTRIQTLIRQATLQPKANDYVFIAYWLDRNFVEKKLHERYADKRVRGEWFCLTNKDIEAILNIWVRGSESKETF